MLSNALTKYQLLGPLRPEEYAALETDIEKRGVLVAVEVDQDGQILDGHNRVEIADRLGKSYKKIVRRFKTETEKREHVLKLNLARRHLDPLRWGQAFKLLLAERGVKRGSGATNRHTSTGATVALVAEELGVPIDTAKKRLAQADAYDKLPAKYRRRVDNGGMTVTQVKREIKEQKREARREKNRAKAAKVADPLKAGVKFATILIDPPWDWGDEGDKDQLGRAKPDYATLSIGEISKLPVAELADDDCHLYMWITNRSLPKGFNLLDAWGFRYITMLTWPKPSFGMGNYFRGQTEHVLFGVHGSQSLRRKDVSTLLPTWARGADGHSSKPAELYDFIESCSPGTAAADPHHQVLIMPTIRIPVEESLERCPSCRKSPLVPFDGCEGVPEGMVCENCGTVYREVEFEVKGGRQMAIWKAVAELQ